MAEERHARAGLVPVPLSCQGVVLDMSPNRRWARGAARAMSVDALRGVRGDYSPSLSRPRCRSTNTGIRWPFARAGPLDRPEASSKSLVEQRGRCAYGTGTIQIRLDVW